MDDESYRHGLKKQFMGQIKNSKLQSSTQYTREQARFQHETGSQPPGRSKTAQRNMSGGDADRMLYEANNSGETYRRHNDSNYIRQLHVKANKHISPAQASCSTAHKYRLEATKTYDMYETDSNNGGDLCSESGKSEKSSKTVLSKRSSQELRKIVKSQCKLHEVIDKTLKQMCSTDVEPNSEEVLRLKEPMSFHNNCNRCNDLLHLRSQNEVISENFRGNILDGRSEDALTISVDDVVNSKVINPMIRKLQRMYLNNLKEEMSLMEDLERLPHKVNEVYKATIFKQKE